MLQAVLRNTRIADGRSFIGMGLLGLVMSFKNAPDFKDAGIAVVSLVLYVAYAFSINNCFDVDTDILNLRKRGKNPIASGELSFRAGIAVSALIALSGVLLAASLGHGELLIYTSMVVLSTLYSAPPRLKARPILDVLSHGLFFGAMPFLYGAYLDGSLSRYEILIGLALLVYSFAMELRNHLEDYESDLKADLRTTPIIIGKQASEKLVIIFSGISIATLLLAFNAPLGALGIMLAGSRISYRALDGVVVSLLLLHAVKIISGA